MAGLVADYGSGSDDEDSDSFQSSMKVPSETPLPKPNFISGADDATNGSVFKNPFIEADNAKTAILEKHVKMISTDVNTVNGKKICWNYRKNKCRFGHNCKYAHDSDLQTDKSMVSQLETNVKQTDLKKVKVYGKVDETLKKKKRPGMSQDITPSKKVMKLYHKQKKIS